MRVFVTDGNFKHTLGAVRSLGKEGCRVTVGCNFKGLCFYSKFSDKKVIYPDPTHEQEFVDFMLNFLERDPHDVLLPVGYDANVFVSKHKQRFSKVTSVPIADNSAMEVASNKASTFGLARRIGLIVPKEQRAEDGDLSFPLVLKGPLGSGDIRYVNSFSELNRFRKKESVIQEYIPGDGYGYSALFNHGSPRAVFMHRRIREYPSTGGASTAAESIRDPVLEELGTRILKALNWNGVAMVEFKKDSRDGLYKLMEINPKFWGSLDLAIASGVNFPYLTARMAAEGDVEPVMDYKEGVKYRWLLPDDVLAAITQPRNLSPFIRDFFDPRTQSNVWLSDIKPAFYQVYATARKVIALAGSGSLRYPNGKPGKMAN